MQIGHYIAIPIILLLIASCVSSRTVTLQKEKLELVNRKIINSDANNEIHLNAQEGDGFAIIPGINFKTGTIEVDLLGEDVQGRSFVGIAFNIQNDSTYEAIYFRPFNFHKKEELNRGHSIQYIFHPKFPWKTLRTEHEGVFEAEFMNPPSPNDWFKVRIVISAGEVKVFSPESGDLLLKVNRLAESKSDKIGLWTGFNSRGGFRNLKISK